MESKDKSIFYTTSYLRSIAMMVGGFFVILFSLSTLIKQENHYSKIEGVIIAAHLTWKVSPYAIKLNTSDGHWYVATIKKYFPILLEKATVGKNAVIWYNDRHEIEKLIVDGEVVVPYYRGVWINIFFICVGLFLMIGNLIYIIRYPSHLAGRRE